MAAALRLHPRWSAYKNRLDAHVHGCDSRAAARFRVTTRPRARCWTCFSAVRAGTNVRACHDDDSNVCRRARTRRQGREREPTACASRVGARERGDADDRRRLAASHRLKMVVIAAERRRRRRRASPPPLRRNDPRTAEQVRGEGAPPCGRRRVSARVVAFTWTQQLGRSMSSAAVRRAMRVVRGNANATAAVRERESDDERRRRAGDVGERTTSSSERRREHNANDGGGASSGESTTRAKIALRVPATCASL